MERLGNFVYYPLEVLSIANGGESMIATKVCAYIGDRTLTWFAKQSGPPGATAPCIRLRTRLERFKILSRSRLKICRLTTLKLGPGQRQRSLFGAQTKKIIGRRFSHNQVYRYSSDGCYRQIGYLPASACLQVPRPEFQVFRGPQRNGGHPKTYAVSAACAKST